MDFLRSMRLRKKGNAADKKKKLDRSTKKKKEKQQGPKSTSSGTSLNRDRSRRKLKKPKQPVESVNIFDLTTLTFQIDSCVTPSATDHTPAQTQAYESFASNVLSTGVDGLMKEYTEVLLPFVPTGYYERAIFDKNTELKKNRYKDVVCNDLTRVVLNDGRPGDYIHANYLKGTKPLYILTQGPMKDSIVDFWRMILQEEVAAICMLCELYENGRLKCEPYFPDKEGQALTYEDITVTCTESVSPDAHTQLKTFCLFDKKVGRTHRVSHYKIITWPDKSIPLSNLSILRTHRNLRKMTGAIVVHCSAGVGRTGTFAAIEIGVQCLLNGKYFQPIDLVKALRHCRLNTVQMDTQYLMLVEAIIDMGVAFKYIEETKILDSFEVYKKQMADYVEAHPAPVETMKPLSKLEEKRDTSKPAEEIAAFSGSAGNVACPIPQFSMGPPPGNNITPNPMIAVAPVAPMALLPPMTPMTPMIPMTPMTTNPMPAMAAISPMAPMSPVVPAFPVKIATKPPPPPPHQLVPPSPHPANMNAQNAHPVPPFSPAHSPSKKPSYPAFTAGGFSPAPHNAPPAAAKQCTSMYL